MIKKEDVSFLSQLIKSLEEAEKKLEEAYNGKNHENFAKSRRLIMQMQKQIADRI